MIYLDKFINDLCLAYNYPAVMVDLMCNACYEGIKGDVPTFRNETPDLRLGEVNENLKRVVQYYCMNSLYGVYELLSNLVDFLVMCTDFNPEQATRVIPVNEFSRMTRLFDLYRRYFGIESEISYGDLLGKNPGLVILSSIKEDLETRLDNLVEEVEEKQGNYTVCQRFFKKGTFFEEACLLIRELLSDGLFKDHRFIDEKLKEYYQTDPPRYPQLLFMQHRKLNPENQPVKATSMDFQNLKDMYQQLDRPGTQQSRLFFNKALVYSGLHTEDFIDCIRIENKKVVIQGVFESLLFLLSITFWLKETP